MRKPNKSNWNMVGRFHGNFKKGLFLCKILDDFVGFEG